MSGRLLVSISSIFDQTRKAANVLVNDLKSEGIEVSLLVAPRIDGDWKLATFAVFVPPRWRMSEGTSEVLPEFDFKVAASGRGLHDLRTGEFLQCRNLSVGEGFGAAKWWRKNVLNAAMRGASRGNTVRLSVSARNLSNPKVARDFRNTAIAALELGAQPRTYMTAI